MKKSISIIDGIMQYLKKDTPVKICKLQVNDELVCDGIIKFVNLAKKIVEIAIPTSEKLEAFNQDDTVTLKFFLEKDNFHVLGVISKIVTDGDNKIFTVVFSTIKRIYNNRKHKRLSVKCKVSIIRKNPSDDNGSLKNISPIGCCFESDSDISLDESVVLGVVDCAHPGLQLGGTVVHKRNEAGKNSYGIVFNNFNTHTHELLSSFIESIQKDMLDAEE